MAKKKFEKEILYVHVRSDSRSLTPGHWFFDDGHHAQCASASYICRNKWSLYLNFEVAGKPLEANPVDLRTLDECKDFVSDYFDGEVSEVSVNYMKYLMRSEM